MSKIAQPERTTQDRVVRLFQNQLGYTYLGNWEKQENRNINEALLRSWLTERGVAETLINQALHRLDQAAALGAGKNLYDANKAVYGLLRYGVKVKAGAGEQTETIWLIDWENPEQNDFDLAEEVSVKGQNKKRPDLVIYVNGIALGVIELKRSSVSVGEGIRQNLDNQKKEFIRNFFTTIQLVMAGNDTEGLRYATIETPEKYYLTWKEENPHYRPKVDDRKERYLPSNPCETNGQSFTSPLDCALLRMATKARFLELIHDFIVFDYGTKKVPRHNQYFGLQAAQKHVQRREGGIIWHTQGSGKSLTMVWLAKWIREHVKGDQGARVLIITDRTDLDEQIEGVFLGVDEAIYRTSSGADLVHTLNASTEWLICSLVHKFGRGDDGESAQDVDAFVDEMQQVLSSDFRAKGEIFVFVDECHRTQSGKLHDAMKRILPKATFIGFTGTPLLKKDKQKSIEVFGRYIHTYKFDEAVADGVVLDLRYEARDIDQYLHSPSKLDMRFENKTKGLSDLAKEQLKQKWGTMQKVYSSDSRLKIIVDDILMDMDMRPRLMDGRGNAMLVCASIYQACKVYELFSKSELAGKCAIVTSYKPSPADIKGEETGEGMTERLNQYAIYRRMLADYFDEPEDDAMYKVDEFEKQVKDRFKKEPGQMRLLIVVDKLLTGFDAPSATYLYIDKQMRDHGLFQAICRVNRLDGEDKEYGYIIDYKDLFHKLEGAISDYTSGALDGYDAEDVAGLLTDRLGKARERLEEARETVKALCEPVRVPRDQTDFFVYFSAINNADIETMRRNEPKRIALYKGVNALVRAYANIANEMTEAGYSQSEFGTIKGEVAYYQKLADEIKIHSGDWVDMKRFEPAMRHLLDTYIRADESEKISEFENLGLIQLIVEGGMGGARNLPPDIQQNPEAMAETIENNVRRIIVDESPVNPTYYEQMSSLLDALIEERRAGALEYADYLERVKELATHVVNPGTAGPIAYPTDIDSRGRRALYDALNHDADLALRIDLAVLQTKKADWVGARMKEREVRNAIREQTAEYNVDVDEILELIKKQDEYK